MVKKKGSKSSNRTGSSAQQSTVPVIEPSSAPTVAAIDSGPPQPVQQMEIETDISTIQHDSSGSNAPEGNNEELLNDGITSNSAARSEHTFLDRCGDSVVEALKFFDNTDFTNPGLPRQLLCNVRFDSKNTESIKVTPLQHLKILCNAAVDEADMKPIASQVYDLLADLWKEQGINTWTGLRDCKTGANTANAIVNDLFHSLAHRNVLWRHLDPQAETLEQTLNIGAACGIIVGLHLGLLDHIDRIPTLGMHVSTDPMPAFDFEHCPFHLVGLKITMEALPGMLPPQLRLLYQQDPQVAASIGNITKAINDGSHQVPPLGGPTSPAPNMQATQHAVPDEAAPVVNPVYRSTHLTVGNTPVNGIPVLNITAALAYAN